jgi:hypothetical protein
MDGVQRALCCMIRSNLLNLTYKPIYKFYFQAFLFINYLTKHQKINNMRLKHDLTLSYLLQVNGVQRRVQAKI